MHKFESFVDKFEVRATFPQFFQFMNRPSDFEIHNVSNRLFRNVPNAHLTRNNSIISVRRTQLDPCGTELRNLSTFSSNSRGVVLNNRVHSR